ncbi:MAG: sn-glycerol 3-phosphate transport system permease protein [Bacteroidales bacterium]|nr:sn-glycerol 3-phosphate transport system permease protein [Bacteroidales bacterium]
MVISRTKKIDTAYLYVLPAVIGCLVFTIYPVVYVMYLSTLSWDLISPDKKFVGLDNYKRLLTSPEFQQVLINSVTYMLVMVTVSISIALVLAVWLNKRTKLHNFVQTSIFTPHIISLVSVAMLWMWIMDPEYGLLNYILGWFGIPRLQWIDNPDTALLSVIIVGIWKVIGYNVLILIAGLQSIPSYIYESAKLDKANRVTTFFKITIPLLSPTLFFLLIVTITSSFQVFDSVRVMTQGGPVNSTNVLVHWIYQTGFEFYCIGEAATGSVLLFIIVAVATFANFKLLASKIHYQ